MSIDSLSQVSGIMLDTCVQATTRWIVDNNESRAVKAALTIALSSTFTVALRSTVAYLFLISAVVRPLWPALFNRHIALTQVSSDCSIRLICLFQSDRTTSFKL